MHKTGKNRIPTGPYGFKPDQVQYFAPDFRNWQYYTARCMNYIYQAQFDRFCVITPEGRISRDLMRPGKDVWFYLRIQVTSGHRGMMLFNGSSFYPLYGFNEKDIRIGTRFNRQEIYPDLFVESDCKFLNNFLDNFALPGVLKDT